MSKTKSYTVKTPIMNGSKRIAPGQEIGLDEDAAKELLSCGAILDTDTVEAEAIEKASKKKGKKEEGGTSTGDGQ